MTQINSTQTNSPQNNLTQVNAELSGTDESKDIKFEEIITGIMSEPLQEPVISETIITEGVIMNEDTIIEPIVTEVKVQEPIITEIKTPEPTVIEPKIDTDHSMVKIQNKVQEVVDVINDHVASKTDEAAIEIVKDIVNEIAAEDKVFIKDKIIVPFEKVALLAAKMSHDALSNLEQYAISGNHWWNSVWWIKVKAQLFVAIVYIALGVTLGSYITTRIYEYKMDQNTELLSAMIYKGKIYDLKVRLQ